MDPISDQFPHVSTYNYAENRPIDGIDLHGLQYINIVHVPGVSTSSYPTGKGIDPEKGFGYTSTTLDFTPGIGDIKGLIEVFTNEDLITGEEIGLVRFFGLIGLSELKVAKKIGGAHKNYFSLASDGYRTGASSIKAGTKTIADTRIDLDGIKKIESHLNNSYFDPSKANQIMIDRLKKIEKGELNPTSHDLHFFTHEIRESNLMNGKYNDASYYSAHSQAAKEFGVKAQDEVSTFYTPEAQKVLYDYD